MTKYYYSAAGQAKLNSQIKKHKDEIQQLEQKVNDLVKYRHTSSKPFDIEMLPDAFLVCVKQCDHRQYKKPASLLPVLVPRSAKPIYYTAEEVL